MLDSQGVSMTFSHPTGYSRTEVYEDAMMKVEAVIHPFKLDEVRAALEILDCRHQRGSRQGRPKSSKEPRSGLRVLCRSAKGKAGNGGFSFRRRASCRGAIALLRRARKAMTARSSSMKCQARSAFAAVTAWHSGCL